MTRTDLLRTSADPSRSRTDPSSDSRTPPKRTVLISGAGVAGPALAYWLNRHGFAVTVVEKAGAPRTGGYPIDVRGTALEVVREFAPMT